MNTVNSRRANVLRRLQAETLLLGLVSAVALTAGTSARATAGAPPPSPLYVTMEELDWRPMNPAEPDGPQMVVLWGDPSTGAYGAFQRYPAGSASPLHSFSTDQKIVMVQGTTLHWTEAESFEAAKRKPLGAFMLMPAGVKHYAACAEDEDCVVFVTQDGPFDFKAE